MKRGNKYSNNTEKYRSIGFCGNLRGKKREWFGVS
jgi:aspartyl/asparaginyl beta-hydroxylase (cupin superfamily)